MATGQVYFAWVDESETTFGPAHLRFDDNVFSFEITHEEGDFCAASVTIRNPRIGPLHASRKRHAWLAMDCGGGVLFKFFGRLVAIPSNLIGDAVTFEFVARPANYEDAKQTLVDTLKVLPYYDPIFIDPQQEEDLDAVIEGYGAIFHIDRESHTVTISDELEGEDGTLSFDTVSFDGLDIQAGGSPVTTVTVDAEFQWTQLADGGIDLTQWITSNWPNEPELGVTPGLITSFTLDADGWPKPGASIGDGWTVSSSTCFNLFNLEPTTRTNAGKTIYKWGDGDTTELEVSESGDFLTVPAGSIVYRPLITEDQSQVQYGDDGEGGREVVSFSRNYADTTTVVPLNFLLPTLVVSFKAARPFKEGITFSLTADLQDWITAPGESVTERLSDLKSVNLSEPLGGDTSTEIPIGDARRRSYITTERGRQSLLHLLALARATLRKKARVVEVTFEPLLERMPSVTLRKNATVVDDRIPGGIATGKIISYRLALDGDADDPLSCEVKIGCAVGLGGTISEQAGTPLYCEEEYIEQSEDYQEYSERIVTLTGEATDDVGLTLPLFLPGDDGIDFISGLSLEQIIEEQLQVNFSPGTQRQHLVLGQNFASPKINPNSPFRSIREEQRSQVVEERSRFLNAVLNNVETVAFFKLRSMSAKFDGGLGIDVTALKVPKQIDLEAA